MLIEQAKGALAARAGLGVAEAFVRMRSYARGPGVTPTAVVEGSVDVRTVAVP